MWFIFKPKEIIEEEKFELLIKFTHVEGDFHGGTFRLIKRFPESITQFHGTIEVPPLTNKESKTVTVEDVCFETSGYCGFCFHNQWTRIGDKEQEFQFLYDIDKARMGYDNVLGINVASKDEIYQKYSVTIALWASVISIIISAIGILLQIFIPQKIIVEFPKNLTTSCLLPFLKILRK